MAEHTKSILVKTEMITLDEKWVNLIFEAKQMGLTIREIYTFLRYAATKREA